MYVFIDRYRSIRDVSICLRVIMVDPSADLENIVDTAPLTPPRIIKSAVTYDTHLEHLVMGTWMRPWNQSSLLLKRRSKKSSHRNTFFSPSFPHYTNMRETFAQLIDNAKAFGAF